MLKRNLWASKNSSSQKSVKSVRSIRCGSMRWKRFLEKIWLSSEWKSEGVTDDDSGDNEGMNVKTISRCTKAPASRLYGCEVGLCWKHFASWLQTNDSDYSASQSASAAHAVQSTRQTKNRSHFMFRSIRLTRFFRFRPEQYNTAAAWLEHFCLRFLRLWLWCTCIDNYFLSNDWDNCDWLVAWLLGSFYLLQRL